MDDDLTTRILDGLSQPAGAGALPQLPAAPRVHAIFEGIATAFPDARVTPRWTITSGEHLVVTGHVRGTHLGSWRGLPPTGRPIDVATTIVLELRAGQIADLSVVTDSLALAEQIGAVAPIGPKACELFDRGAGVA